MTKQQPQLPIFEFSKLSIDPREYWSSTEILWREQQEQQQQPANLRRMFTGASSTIQPPQVHVNNGSTMAWSPNPTSPSPSFSSSPYATNSSPISSIQSRLISKTTFIPLNQLIRPIAPAPLDQAKVASMIDTIYRGSSSSSSSGSSCPAPAPAEGRGVPDKLPPVDVLYYKTKTTGREYYFAFGGCHRLSACEMAGTREVECKVLKVTKGMLKGYLGGSLAAILGEEDSE